MIIILHSMAPWQFDLQKALFIMTEKYPKFYQKISYHKIANKVCPGYGV